MDIHSTKGGTGPTSDADACRGTDRGDVHKPSNLQTIKTYRVNECFYSIQGEGVRAGTPNVFIRFSGCNQTCKKETHGFDCDTEFTSGRALSLLDIEQWVLRELQKAMPQFIKPLGGQWIILTGGEPALQVDKEFIIFFQSRGWKLAMETNGSLHVGDLGLDWITVSPKVAEHCIKQDFAHEVKYVRGYGQGIPKTVVKANHYIISPAFDGMELDEETLQWCIKLVKENPQWRLSVQQHKFLKVR